MTLITHGLGFKMDPNVFRKEAIVLLKTGSGHFDNADLKAIDMMAVC